MRIYCQIDGKRVNIYAKYETWNYSGSIKDRMVLQILKNSYSVGALSPKDTIVEASSGNTGIAFAAMGAFLGHSVEIYMPEWLSDERKRLLRFYGAKLYEVTAQEGGFLQCIDLATKKGAKKGYFCPKQFESSHNPTGHSLTTAPELQNSLINAGYGEPDIFVAGVGTGGTIMGIYRHFSQINEDFQAFPVFPKPDEGGSHRIEGIGDSFIPKILSLDELGKIIRVSDSDAIIAARKLNKAGLSVGISSGANLFAAAKKAASLHQDLITTTVFADGNKKYLSTDLCSDSQENSTAEFEILEYEIIS